MKYAGIIKDDFAAAPGVSTTLFTQGCPHRCKGCHNPETWDFEGGMEFTPAVFRDLLESLNQNGIKRNLCIMGGEPLCKENFPLVKGVVVWAKLWGVKKIYIWTGYLIEKLPMNIYDFLVDEGIVVIDGPYIEEQRDITLPMRGSKNQRIFDFSQNL